ncbi:methyltransferase domain-containing protein [Aquimarina pacifica]|uniref:methyltransferase domain-containing protein n=1 Tax=Aquimarina pacifica TaxID=1296415 RepID=UPI00046EE29A|nr:methyltransferase domain-containing protein [Aquimarina pacifica]
MNSYTIFEKLKEKSSTTNEKIIKFYDEATEDYEFWSKDFNMHFGYYIPFKTNFLKRDTMLNQMNDQVFDRLQPPKQNAVVVDLGCGMGGTIRHGLRKYPLLHIIGVSLSNFQVTEGNKRLKNMNGLLLEENFCDTTFASNSIDGTYAIESFCHAGHSFDALKEAHRILKPGSRLVIADAFLKKEENELCIGDEYCYNQLCKGWSLDGLGNINTVHKHLERIGFKNIHIEDISFRVAPSVLHVPFATIGFILKKILKKQEIQPQSWKNLKGSLFALLSGLHMKSFGYYLVTAEK